ncbi:IclR family transcriptional regulator domain-containing protein [Sphingomonas turrisvirgatae]|uniref:IclR family transcriptional regulator domain-containing protein n=1 Tax=Sphingomonas turrisvirgatae TaxID=1888892 RepID=UPI001300E1A1|nr:IclR family transcriptional regulator C-terminal domain-containing protein [Sphingomonas turrisvirgatae]
MAIDGRLLTVIKSINDLGICTVVDLHRVTGISRPAIHRMVDSLCSFGYTERVSGKSAIRLTSQILSLSAGYKPESRLAEKAAPVLAELQKRLRWPLTFATPEDDVMVVQETTRDSNPFVFDSGRTGLHLPMTTTAMGCAYLSACTTEDREAVLERHRRRSGPDDVRGDGVAAARYRIAQAAEKGYALRSGGEPERTSTIAVPVVVYSTAVGALCTTFPTSAVVLGDALNNYVPLLQESARAIAASFEN